MKFPTTLLLAASAVWAIAIPATSLDAVKRDGAAEFDDDMAVFKRTVQEVKRDGAAEFDDDMAVFKRTVESGKDEAKRDGAAEFNNDIAVF